MRGSGAAPSRGVAGASQPQSCPAGELAPSRTAAAGGGGTLPASTPL